MKRKAIIVGSAPISADLSDADLSNYHRIAINKSWRLRDDFNTHVFLRSLKPKDRPDAAGGMTSVGIEVFANVLNKAGGLFITSGSVAMIAGYWAATHCDARYVSFFGCDLVFDTTTDQPKTHYYGTGDEGPLLGNFQYNLRQEERAIRLFIWGLMHRVIMTNSSALPGTKLCFPHLSVDAESNDVFREVFASRECAELLKLGGQGLAFEAMHRTETFYKKQKLFEADEDALAAMNAILDNWGGYRPAIEAFNEKFAQIVGVS